MLRLVICYIELMGRPTYMSRVTRVDAEEHVSVRRVVLCPSATVARRVTPSLFAPTHLERHANSSGLNAVLSVRIAHNRNQAHY